MTDEKAQAKYTPTRTETEALAESDLGAAALTDADKQSSKYTPTRTDPDSPDDTPASGH